MMGLIQADIVRFVETYWDTHHKAFPRHLLCRKFFSAARIAGTSSTQAIAELQRDSIHSIILANGAEGLVPKAAWDTLDATARRELVTRGECRRALAVPVSESEARLAETSIPIAAPAPPAPFFKRAPSPA